ncbi:fatty acyl-CoA reductase wat-like [Lycorma delicatula]|uniref:fatty acyl-CoA reductase wat-like n=1 Tax=Lycorma delicatula TaxID=130591 RepID=UPI003F50F907
MTWNNFCKLGKRLRSISIFAYTISILILVKDKFKFSIFKFFLHYLPELLIDIIAQIFGKEKRQLKISENVDKFSQLVSHFSTRQWDFSNKNTQDLWKSLDQKDKEIFPFNIEDINREEYFYNYTRGIRQYLLKDNLSTIPAAKKRAKRIYLSNYILLIFFIFVFGCITWIAVGLITSFGSIIVPLIYDYFTYSSTHLHVIKMKKIMQASLTVLIAYIIKKYLDKYEDDIPVQYISLRGGMFIFDNNNDLND